jgi:hypothetical protein
MRLSVIVLLSLLLVPAAPRTGAAQQFARPELPKEADPNDWEAYYDQGVERLGTRLAYAEAAFYWASRLRPDRAEPLYARWIAFWAHDYGKYGRWLSDDERVIHAPEVLAADSLRVLALRRSPFVHQGLVVFLHDHLEGRWRDNDATRSWIHYGQGNLPLALDGFGRLIQRDPTAYGYLRFQRASAFANLARYDSAAAEIDALLVELRASDEKHLVSQYSSKELLEFARGLLYLQQRSPADARAAFARALMENPGFAPAHAELGELALAARDPAAALLEYGQAVEVSPDDVVLRLGHGRALLAAGHAAEAAVELRRAIALDPEWAEPYVVLGNALQKGGDAAGARTAWAEFLSHAPRNEPRRAWAEQQVAMP